MNDKAVFAMSATTFFGILAVALLYFGDFHTRVTVMVALYAGAMSQFLAQDHRPMVQGFALVMSYAAMLLTIAAMVGYATANG